MRINSRFSRLWCFCVCSALFGWGGPAWGQATREFDVTGVTLTLREVTDEVGVYFTSMRLNRALQQWNVEVSVSNKTGQSISGPMVLLVESHAGTSGPMGTHGSSDGKGYYDLSSQLQAFRLPAGGSSLGRTLALGYVAGQTPRIVTRVFAAPLLSGVVAYTRTLDGLGQPLPGVVVDEFGPGEQRSYRSDPAFGGVTMGREAGSNVWRFSLPGHFTAWRKLMLSSNEATVLPFPRLASANGKPTLIAAGFAGELTNSQVRVRFGPEAFAQAATGAVSVLDGQSLPLPLPLGWSPLQAFRVELTGQPFGVGVADVELWEAAKPGESAGLAHFDESTLTWRYRSPIVGSGEARATGLPIPRMGTYVVVVPDAGAGAPAFPGVDEALPSGQAMPPTSDALRAEGTVVPRTSLASRVPEAVTGRATLVVSNVAGPLVSGSLVRGQVSEVYELLNGTRLTPPAYDAFIVGYQRPGDGLSNTVHARFGIRPVHLFGPEELVEARVRMDIYPPNVAAGALVGAAGGVLADGPVRLVFAPGQFEIAQFTELRRLENESFQSLAGSNAAVVAAFEVSFQQLRDGSRVLMAVEGLKSNATYVLARAIVREGRAGLTPVERFRTGELGVLISEEPGAEPRLEGLSQPGQYVLLEMAPKQALVAGVARDTEGVARAGLLVRVAGQPWLAVTREGGAYRLLAPAGSGSLTVVDGGTGDSGELSLLVAGDLAPVLNAHVDALLSGPRVVSISPTNGAALVSSVASVTVDFSRPLNPAGLVGQAITLTTTNGQPVNASVSLNLANTRATILPNAPLAPGTTFLVTLSTNIADLAGRPLEGETRFRFSTVPISSRSAGAQLIIYEPGATNVPQALLSRIPAYTPGTNRAAIVVHGTEGSGDPGRPVVLVNESTGETTTVLANPDGSFVSVIEGSAEDFISATFVNLNSTRVYIPVSRQIFDNGFVGLYKQGGILEAQSDGGPVRVYIEPEAIQTKAKFKLETVRATELRALLEGTEPETGKIAGNALRFRVEGDAPVQPVRVSIPADLRTLGYPQEARPSEAAAVLTLAREVEGEKVFEVVDQLVFKPAEPEGARKLSSEELRYGAFNTVVGFIPGADMAQPILDYLIVPLLLGHMPVAVKGRTFAIDPELAAALDATSLPGSFVPGLDTLTDAVKFQISKPIGGAFISLSELAHAQIGKVGRVRPGMIYATSDRSGHFLLVAPLVLGVYHIVATHPLFDDKESETLFPVGNISLAGAVFHNIFFTTPSTITGPPRVSVSNAPLQPAPGEPTTVKILASQGVSGPPRIGVSVRSVVSAVAGVPAGLTNVTIGEPLIVDSGNTREWTATVRADRAAVVVLKIVVQGANGTGMSPVLYPISFVGTPPEPEGNEIPASDINDVHGPIVVSTTPPERGYVADGGQVDIVFNKPIDRYVLEHTQGIILSGSANPVLPVVRLSKDQLGLTLQFTGLDPDTEYTLTLNGQSIRDLNGRPLDQRPTTDAPDSFVTTFRTPPSVRHDLPQAGNARGAVMSKGKLYVIDTHQGNWLLTYDITQPASPRLLSRLRLFAAPRDLALVPQYSYKRNIHEDVRTADLVVVVGGDLHAVYDGLDSVVTRGQYLWVVDMADPADPQVVASPIVSYRVGSTVVKAKWSAPYVVYQEFAADIHLLGFVNLQELILGYGSTKVQLESFPKDGREGEDKNGDGDYVDEGDKLPLPPHKPGEFYGKKINYVLENSTQKLLDFDVTGGGSLVGVSLSGGFVLDQHGERTSALQPMYRTWVYQGMAVNMSNPESAALPFGASALPRRVTVIEQAEVLITNRPVILPLALVSLAPDRDGKQKLAVVDLTEPRNPKLLNKIEIPEALLGGGMGSLVVRKDGYLELAGNRNSILLNSAYLAYTNALPEGQAHPAITGFVPQGSSGMRSVGLSDFGVRVPVDGSRAEVVVSPPQMEFVSFPALSSLINPYQLPQDDEDLNLLMLQMRRAPGISPARFKSAFDIESDLLPPRPAAHFHVLVKAPGGAGRTIRLGLESVNYAGRPLANLGNGFAPVRAVTDFTQDRIDQRPREVCGTPIRPLTAHRMSDDPNSEYYNRYLSIPFALVVERVTPSELATLRGAAIREVLWSGAGLRAFIDPEELGLPAIGHFAAKIDDARKLIYPVASVVAATLNQSYIPGDNPPPPGGDVPMPDSHSSVSAHSGEFRTAEVDMALPSPSMAITIERAIGSQDTYEGPFGMGWDFNYNQRLTELTPDVFPEGLQLPLVARATKAESEVAGSQDVLFHDGLGRIVHFRWIADEAPPEFTADPLVRELRYAELASDFYLPGRGEFDLLVKFKDGRFERLTPQGERFTYSNKGRLEKVTDTFPANYHELEYDRNGWLVKIVDRSVTADRFLEIGYYRRVVDPEFRSGLDEPTTKSYVEGKICRLKDYAGADVLFFYSDQGLLLRRESVRVEGENGGFSGRMATHYLYDGCQIRGVAAGASGDPVFAVAAPENSRGKPVARSGSGTRGGSQYDVPVENRASTLEGQVSKADLEDGTSTEYKFDKFGHVTVIKTSGDEGQPIVTETQFNEDGLTMFIKHPEGNTEAFTYDSENPVFRSRANLLSRRVDPGPRGGASYTETFAYDRRYNLRSGAQQNANGFTIRHALRPDGRATASVQYGDAGTDSFSYNDNGQLLSETSHDGTETAVTYDGATGFIRSQRRGKVASTFSYDGGYASQLGMPSGQTLAEGAARSFKYDAALRPVENARGTWRERFTYDELGRVVARVEDVGEGQQKVERFVYDSKSFLTDIYTDNVEVDGQPTSLNYHYAPDTRGRVGHIRNPDASIHEFKYNAAGLVTKVTRGDYIEETVYDRNGNPTSVKQGDAIVETLTYDGHDQVTRAVHPTDAGENVISHEYYPGGERKSTTITDPVYGLVDRQTFDQIDELGRPLKSQVHGVTYSPAFSYTYGRGSLTVTGPRHSFTRTWDEGGLPLTYSDPLQTLTSVTDDAGRVRREEERSGDRTYTVTIDYDAQDHVQKLQDELGLQMQYRNRADGRVLSTRNARDNGVNFGYTVLGEEKRMERTDGMTVLHRYNAMRQESYVGDPSAGFALTYDGQSRLKQRTYRNGNVMTVEGFDSRNMPLVTRIPGGTITRTYDAQQRIKSSTTEFNGNTYSVQNVYDALDRIRKQTFAHDGGPANVLENEFDPAGGLLSARTVQNGREYVVRYAYGPDGKRRSITYPSGVVVNEERDSTGRLVGVSDAGGNLVRAVSWDSADEPSLVELGRALQLVNTFDARGRLVGARYTNRTNGAVLAHLRYQYDGADNLEIRQYVHRAGKADLFAYDAGERVRSASIGAAANRGSGFGAADYQRSYQYEPSGLDFLVTAPVVRGTNAPPFASRWGAHDGFLVPGQVDGVAWASDEVGNVSQAVLHVRAANGTQPVAVGARLVHDGLNQLVKADLEGGGTVRNEYLPNGLRMARKVAVNGISSERAFVYDGQGRLLEEYEVADQRSVLMARYFYATGDAPQAADLREDVGSPLKRYYLLRAADQSIVAIANDNGEVVERISYDTFGQPSLEARDSSAPRVTRVVAEAGGRLKIVLSEAVAPSWDDPGPGGGPVILTNALQGAVALRDTATGQALETTVEWDPINPEMLVASAAGISTNAVELTLRSNLSDEWGNRAETIALTFIPTGSVGAVYYQFNGSGTNTAARRVARSSTGLSLLFQGQYLEYDTGLIYMRARFYDPYAGMFLEPDPLGYEDSVNHYAGLANNPVSMRDPSGLISQRLKDAVAQRRMIRAQLWAHGNDDLEISAILSVMKRRSDAGMSVRLGLRSPLKRVDGEITAASKAKAASRRKHVAEGKQQKGQLIAEKSNEEGMVIIDPEAKGISKRVKKLFREKREFTGDIDGFHLLLNDKVSTLKELNEFQREVNQEYRRLWKVRRYPGLAKANPGKKFHPNPPFQHYFSILMGEQHGMRYTKLKHGRLYSGKVGNYYSGNIGNRGMVYEIGMPAHADALGISVREMSNAEMLKIMSDAREVILERSPEKVWKWTPNLKR